MTDTLLHLSYDIVRDFPFKHQSFFLFFKLIVELLFLVEESEKVKVKSLSGVRLFVTPCTVVYWAPLSMGFSRQGCRGGLPFPFPGDLPDPGTEPMSPALPGGFFATEPPGKPQILP